MDQTFETINCACVIHGDVYSWKYVERLYNMLQRHITLDVRLHVYTEESREVPYQFIKHNLIDWKISGPKKSWWYKIQLFNPENYAGPLLYFDLDTVITDNIDWVWQNSTEYFWAVRDFKYLWNPTSYEINSSIMWWDTTKYTYIWENFKQQDLNNIMIKYRGRGDQNYIGDMITQHNRHFFDINRVQSWRWQCLDGGYDFNRRCHRHPDTGTQLLPSTNILIFHGNPKPDQIIDSVIQQHWQ